MLKNIGFFLTVLSYSQVSGIMWHRLKCWKGK